MQTVRSVVFVLLLVSGFAAAVHEKRRSPLENIQDRHRIEQDAVLPIRIGLRPNQEAVANGEAWLRDVSDPDSSNYGKHWKQEQVIEAFKPSNEAVAAVEKWLASHGIEEYTHTDNKMWIALDLPAGQAEALLQTKYFEHFRPKGESGSGRFEVSSDEYYLPEDLREHIDLIKPGITPSVITGRTARSRDFLKKLAQERRLQSFKESTSRNKTKTPPPFPANDLTHCNYAVSPACVRALYNFSVADPSLPASSENHMGIFESMDWAPQKYLNEFWSYYTHIPPDTSPFFKSIDGAILTAKEEVAANHSTSSDNPFPIRDDLGEAIGDLECSMPIIYPQNATIFEEDDYWWSLYENGRFSVWYFNDFLDTIDGSYCRTSDYFKSFPEHVKYPDPRPYGYKGKLECGVFKPTNIISISYGVDELPEGHLLYKERQCLEFMKLSLQGVSVFIASGDSGVGPFYNQTWHNKVFTTPFPGACPWVTSVGATKIAHNKTVYDPEITTGWSSGGFSVLYPRPWYQEDTLKTYFAKYAPSNVPYFHGLNWKNTSGLYNRDGRGFPDISAVAESLATIGYGGWGRFTGTSASTPIVAALFNRIIEERIRIGKGPLGLINPVLYKYPEAFHDILVGKNYGWWFTGWHKGFECVPGWDPVTGVGTPNYPKMLEVFLNLP